MRIKIIYTITVVLILLIIGITVYYNFGYGALLKKRCPASCGNWVYGSCIDKQLYMERECKESGAGCGEKRYYETKMITVGACSQTDCKEGKKISNYKCI